MLSVQSTRKEYDVYSLTQDIELSSMWIQSTEIFLKPDPLNPQSLGAGMIAAFWRKII